MKNLVLVFFLLAVFACNKPAKENSKVASDSIDTTSKVKRKIEAITVLSDTIYSTPYSKGDFADKLEQAKVTLDQDPTNANAIIWYGRYTAYTGQYKDAIRIYTEGIKQHPNDARLYRHRGHRYISIRQLDKAIADFEMAATLIEGTEDLVEPDGMPNAMGIPVSTLHGNIYYHLGLAYYLKNDLDNALRVYRLCEKSSKNDDMVVSTGHWLYMTLRKLNQKEAADSVVANINLDMNVIENGIYQNMCLFYKGTWAEGTLKKAVEQAPINDVVLYGLGNWAWYQNKDKTTAKAYFEKVLQEGNKLSFAYIAAEADYYRLVHSE